MNGIDAAPVIVVMGVCGCRKTTLGRKLAQTLCCTFVDADDFHPDTNISKMRAGIPLEDSDRWPWLQACREYSVEAGIRHSPVVLACSALKASYRRYLSNSSGVDLGRHSTAETLFIFLKCSVTTLNAHLSLRRGHFADARLLASQCADLEEPMPCAEYRVIVLEVSEGESASGTLSRVISSLRDLECPMAQDDLDA
jgi:gluconokinase